MTPEAKAQELLNKYRTYVVKWTGGVEVENENVRQCALIAVDEIIEAIEMFGYAMCLYDDHETGKLTTTDDQDPCEYFRKVKEEIINKK